MRSSKIIPWAVAIFIILVSFSVWAYQIDYDETQALNSLEDYVKLESMTIENQLYALISPVSKILVATWALAVNQTHTTIDYELFLHTVPTYYQLHSNYLAINFINNSGVIRYVYPYEPNVSAINRSVIHTADGSINTVFLEAQNTGEVRVTSVIRLFQGQDGIVVYTPVIIENTLFGYVTVVMEIANIFDIIDESQQIFSSYYVLVYDHDRMIFCSDEDFDRYGKFVGRSDISLYNLKWSLYVKLPPDEIDGLHPLNHSYFIVIGSIVGLLMYYSMTRYYQKHQMELAIIQERKNRDEFNNLLMGILSQFTLIRTVLEMNGTDTHVRENLDSVEKLIFRSKELTSQILLFSRQSKVDVGELDIVDLIYETLKIFDVTVDRRIKTMVHVSTQKSKILANGSQVCSVLLNLLNNAMDASKDHGLIDITISSLPRSELALDDLRVIPNSEFEDLILVKISDNGTGIDPKYLNQVFDPFFTTKSVDKGTGLGLALTYTLMTGIGGGLGISSTLGKGTTVNLIFPSVDPISKPVPVRDQTMVSNFQKCCDIKILIIDDEVEISQGLAKYFGMYGYHADVVFDGKQGLELYEQNPTYDILVIDINLPGSSGIDVADQIKHINPDQEVILITGYNDFEYDSEIDVIYKPFSPIELHYRILNMVCDSQDNCYGRSE